MHHFYCTTMFYPQNETRAHKHTHMCIWVLNSLLKKYHEKQITQKSNQVKESSPILFGKGYRKIGQI